MSSQSFVKLTTENCIHNGYIYKEGLNFLNGPFNKEKFVVKVDYIYVEKKIV